jgi:hypothetical protein
MVQDTELIFSGSRYAPNRAQPNRIRFEERHMLHMQL